MERPDLLVPPELREQTERMGRMEQLAQQARQASQALLVQRVLPARLVPLVQLRTET